MSKEELKALDLDNLKSIARLTLDFEKLHNIGLDYKKSEESLLFSIARQHLMGPVYERRIAAMEIIKSYSSSSKNQLESNAADRLA